MRFTMKRVEPKDGIMRDVHEDVLGRPCYIAYLRVNEQGVISYLPDWDEKYHSLRTSTVENFTHSNDGNCVFIETRNTVYTLERDVQ